MKLNQPQYQSNLILLNELEINLRNLDISSLPISDYSKRYFGDYLRKLNYSIKACSFIVKNSLKNIKKPINEICFIDHGGGIGLLSCVAKLSGVGKVIYTDIYDIATHDAEIIAKALGIEIDHYVAGDVDELIKYTQNHQIHVDIVASRNVIEHIYNPDIFIDKISKINNSDLQLFFATTANPDNPLVNYYTRRIHKKLEYRGMGENWGNKERDQVIAYYDIRKKIIQEHFPEIKKDELEMLTKKTRGYIKNEIIQIARNYFSDHKIPAGVIDSTNTCDPYTGNWAEHLVPVSDYKTIFNKYHFTFSVLCGFYNTSYQKKYLNFITPLLNFLIYNFLFSAKYLAPFICLSAYRSKNS